MGCEQNCVEENGTHRCTCDEEHRLGDDNKTCVEKGEYLVCFLCLNYHECLLLPYGLSCSPDACTGAASAMSTSRGPYRLVRIVVWQGRSDGNICNGYATWEPGVIDCGRCKKYATGLVRKSWIPTETAHTLITDLFFSVFSTSRFLGKLHEASMCRIHWSAVSKGFVLVRIFRYMGPFRAVKLWYSTRTIPNASLWLFADYKTRVCCDNVQNLCTSKKV